MAFGVALTAGARAIFHPCRSGSPSRYCYLEFIGLADRSRLQYPSKRPVCNPQRAVLLLDRRMLTLTGYKDCHAEAIGPETRSLPAHPRGRTTWSTRPMGIGGLVGRLEAPSPRIRRPESFDPGGGVAIVRSPVRTFRSALYRAEAAAHPTRQGNQQEIQHG